MPDMLTRTALVTGASSGLGYEAAAQLAELGCGTVIITARTDHKARFGAEGLVARTGKHTFEVLTLDLDTLKTVEAAAETLADRGQKIDLLLLNAGMAPAKEISRNIEGIETTISSSLVGHHLLTMRLLDAELLSDDAHIIIAGSEAARGNVPIFHPVSMDTFAAEHFAADLQAHAGDGAFGRRRRRALPRSLRLRGRCHGKVLCVKAQEDDWPAHRDPDGAPR